MNIGVHIHFQIIVFIFFRYIPRSGTAGTYGSSIFSYLKRLHTAFHNDYTKLHPHQQCTGVPFSSHFHQHLLFTDFFNVSYSDSPLWFWFAILWWWATLSIFSFVWWQSTCLLLRNIHLFCPFLNLFLFVSHWVVRTVFMFWILIPYQSYNLHLFSPIQQVVFSCCWFSLLCKTFKFN